MQAKDQNKQEIQQNQSDKVERDVKLFNDRWMLKKKISSGSFGVVFIGQEQNTKEFAAIKLEKEDNEEVKRKSLDREIQVLKKLQGVPCTPQLIWYGQENNFNVLIQSLLGKDLSYYLKPLKTFSISTILQLLDQLIPALEAIHKKAVVHRDLKPENILMGREQNSHLAYLIDFGISKIFRDQKGRHISQYYGKPFIGTTRYASIAAHLGKEISRKDDLESLGYVMIYFIKGVLPWQNLQDIPDEDRTKRVGKIKQEIKIPELCKDLPFEFQKFFEYIRKLKFKECPDYQQVKAMFMNLGKKLNINYSEYEFDWIKDKKHEKGTNYSQKSQISNTTGGVKPRSSILTNNSTLSNNAVSNLMNQENKNFLNPNFNSNLNTNPNNNVTISRGSIQNVYYPTSQILLEDEELKYLGSFQIPDDQPQQEEQFSSEGQDDEQQGEYSSNASQTVQETSEDFETMSINDDQIESSTHLSSVPDSKGSLSTFKASIMDEWNQFQHLNTKLKTLQKIQVKAQFFKQIILNNEKQKKQN